VSIKKPVPKILTSKSLFRNDSYFESLLSDEYGFTLQLRARGDATLEETVSHFLQSDVDLKLRFICWQENGDGKRTKRWARIFENIATGNFLSEISDKNGVAFTKVKSDSAPEAERKLLILIERNVSLGAKEM
jgi:hypothetical protein